MSPGNIFPRKMIPILQRLFSNTFHNGVRFTYIIIALCSPILLLLFTNKSLAMTNESVEWTKDKLAHYGCRQFTALAVFQSVDLIIYLKWRIRTLTAEKWFAVSNRQWCVRFWNDSDLIMMCLISIGKQMFLFINSHTHTHTADTMQTGLCLSVYLIASKLLW